MRTDPLRLAEDGAQLVADALSETDCHAIEAALVDCPDDRPGIRLAGMPALRPLLAADGAVGRIAANVLDPHAKPVRALLFDKSADNNWALGWHRLGRLPETAVERLAAERGERNCLAERGDVWLYATPIVHASRATATPRRRRVLQVDYAAEALPAPLRWLGV